jgi:hypothetical protein
VMDLYSRVNVGTKVVVLPISGGRGSDRVVHSQPAGSASRVN